jgi:hypothetical protein
MNLVKVGLSEKWEIKLVKTGCLVSSLMSAMREERREEREK